MAPWAGRGRRRGTAFLAAAVVSIAAEIWTSIFAGPEVCRSGGGLIHTVLSTASVYIKQFVRQNMSHRHRNTGLPQRQGCMKEANRSERRV